MLAPSTMRSWFTIALMAQLFGAVFATADTADVTESELMQVATTLARQYDAGYAAKDPGRRGGPVRRGWRAGIAGRPDR